MGNRVPRFESHIRHMIRPLDRARMLSRFDLWDYDDVTQSDNLESIVDRISRARTSPVHGEMPPGEFGGPWPLEWIDLFQRWVDSGCPRLEQVTADLELRVVPVTSTVSTLTAAGANPTFGYATWLEPEFNAAGSLRFSLFREPPETVPPFGDLDFLVSIDFEHGGASEAFVNGIRVPMTSPAPPSSLA